MITPYNARIIVRDDFMDVVALARLHHSESRYANKAFDGERVYKLCEACLEIPHYTCAVLVHQSEESPVGYMAAVIEPYIWSSIEAAREMALYIHPGHRSYASVRQLVRVVEEWAIEKGADTFDIGSSSSPDQREVLRVGQVYEKMGYMFHCVSYIKELKQ